jgi:hypothetical protein
MVGTRSQEDTIADRPPASPLCPVPGASNSADADIAGSPPTLYPALNTGPARPLARERAEQEWKALAPLLAGEPLMRTSPDGGRTFPAWWDGDGRRRREVKLSPRLPAEPVTVPVFDSRSGTGRMLALDFDVSRAARLPRVADPVARVEMEAAAVVALIERLGGRAVTDRSPTSGRHVYVRFAQSLPWMELRDACRALAARFPTIDVSPMMQLRGQIRIPGSGHKIEGGRLTGWMALTMPLDEAVTVATSPCGPQVWNALVTELTAEYAELTSDHLAPAADAPGLTGLPHDDEGMPWLPRIGGARPADPGYAAIAQSDAYDTGRYASGSEARQAVLESCVRRGWRLQQVRDRIASGEWAGLWELYGKRRRGEAARQRALDADWRKAVQRAIAHPTKGSTGVIPPADCRMENSGRKGDTSLMYSRPPVDGETVSDQVRDVGLGLCWRSPVQRKDGVLLNEWQMISTFQNAVWIAERDTTERRHWGRRAGSIRRVLRALMVASRLSGSTTTGFGVRYLGLIAGLDYRLVAKILRQLRDERDPWVDHVEAHHHDEPDRYMLRVPARYREAAVWRRWRAGLIPAIHPAFRALSAPCAFVYEALDDVPTGAAQIATTAAVSSSATTDALRELAEHGLAERVPATTGEPGGWKRGPLSLDDVARALGAETEQEELTRLYADQRREWRGLLASLAVTPATSAAEDPDPGQAAFLADLHAQEEPPEQHPGPAEDLPAQIPSSVDHEASDADPLAWITPAHEAAMDKLAELGLTHPQATRRTTPARPPRWRRRTAARAQPRATTTPPTPLVPMQAAEMAELAANDPALKLLVDQLGAVVLTEATPPS